MLLCINIVTDLMQKSKTEIAILDFGSQYTHLVARRVRELGVKSSIYQNDVDCQKLENAYGIILSGGPISVIGAQSLSYDKNIFNLDIPILGICHGHQLIAKHFGGVVIGGQTREYGTAKIETKNSEIFSEITNTTVWMSHGDSVEILPDGFFSIASSTTDLISAMENIEKKIFSLQFHPEVHHSIDGQKMLHNFVLNICQAKKNWDTSKIVEQIKEKVLKQTKNKKVFLLVSGGVDSTVCFCLLEKFLGKENVYGLYVDHGFMRQNETEQVKEKLKKSGFENLHIVDASEKFREALKDVSLPEEKRKIIGNLFLDVVNSVMAEKGFSMEEYLLGQGTIYPDIIESGGSKNAEVIKTHHNRVEILQKMIKENKVIEPLSYLYKDEVREVGINLGLDKDIVRRHPFPGPGLAIRTLCSDEEINSGVKVMNHSIEGYALYHLPINSVGVQGDERTYSNPGLLISKDNKVDWNFLKIISPSITNTNKDINRVITMVAGNTEKILNCSVKRSFLDERVEKLRKLDEVVNRYVLNDERCNHIWQMPAILLPFGHTRFESLLLRPVESEEAMTVSFASIPAVILSNIVKEVKKLDLVDYIFYDITNKPPGTIEWE